MADTRTSPNNKSVSFGKKMEREMTWSNDDIGTTQAKNPAGVKNKAPMKPEKQADGAQNPAGVTNAAPMKAKKSSHKKAARHAMKRGMISEKAAKKHHVGGY